MTYGRFLPPLAVPLHGFSFVFILPLNKQNDEVAVLRKH